MFIFVVEMVKQNFGLSQKLSWQKIIVYHDCS